MENETSHASWLGVMLVTAVILISGIALSMTYGRNTANNFMSEMYKWVGVESTELKQLNGTTFKTSAANAQLLICRNSDSIDFFESNCIIPGTDKDLSVMTTVVNGDVIVEVSKTTGSKGYSIHIHAVSCDIDRLTGTCNCGSR